MERLPLQPGTGLDGSLEKHLGPRLKVRSFSRQITEVQLGQKVLNTMTGLRRPVFERISLNYSFGKG